MSRDNGIQCELCEMWFHTACEGINNCIFLLTVALWFCAVCRCFNVLCTIQHWTATCSKPFIHVLNCWADHLSTWSWQYNTILDGFAMCDNGTLFTATYPLWLQWWKLTCWYPDESLVWVTAHNHRIECLWGDVHREVTQPSCIQFYDMEDTSKFKSDDDVHRFALHSVSTNL